MENEHKSSDKVSMSMKSALQEDLARFSGRIRWSDGALWTICFYRLGRMILEQRNETTRRLLLSLFFPLSRLVETVSKNSFPVFAQIGGGLKIASSGMIVLHSGTVIGRNCTLHRGVTIGNTREGGPVPTVGDNVEFGAYAQILGGIQVGDGAKIASMSVVVKNVPANSIFIGIPAKVASRAIMGALAADLASFKS